MDLELDVRDAVKRLQDVLDGSCGKLRVVDAMVLAGYDRPSYWRGRVVASAMRQLGWQQCRCRFDGVLQGAYARGTAVQRETILEVSRRDDGSCTVTRRDP